MKLRSALAAALAALPMLGGCTGTGSVYANVRDVEDLQLIQTLGYDRGEDGRVVISAASGAGSEEMPAARLTGKGRSIPDALRDLRGWSSREEPFFSHVQCVVVGEDAAAQGLEELLDWAERSPQLRLDLPLFLVEGGSAKPLVTGSEDDKYESGAVLMALQRDVEYNGEAFCFTLSDVATHLARSGCALCCSVRAADPAQAVPSSQDALTARETGFAVLRDGKLLGFTGADAARGICLLLNKAGAGNVLLPDGAGGQATAALDGGGAKLTAHFDAAGRPWLEVTLRYRAGITEAWGSPDLEMAAIPALNEAFSAWLTARAQDALGLSRAMEADYLELGRLFERCDPVRWQLIDWEKELPTLRCRIEAEGVVERSYDIGAPAHTQGDGLGHV